MQGNRRFSWSSLKELQGTLANMNIHIPLSEELDILGEPLTLGKTMIPNRIAIHPMEGCDGTPEGKPDDLTFRRYERFASGGAGLV
ncbi:NADH:flavin oxidoreductase, partial [bacterium]|nr:NADH:flavin oxidoreductase [bacterium]